MENARLPLEICEFIIDSCYVDADVSESMFTPLREYVVLGACALTCTGWISQTPRTLHGHIWIHRPHNLDLLERTILRRLRPPLLPRRSWVHSVQT